MSNNNKNIIVTGSSRGIGFELVRQLSDRGHNVLAISRSMDTLENIPTKIHRLAADIGTQSGIDLIQTYLKKIWKQVDVVIHNAGKLIHKPFAETTNDDFESVYRTNVFGVAALTRMVLPYFVQGSHVVAISSMGGIQGSVKFAGLSAYSSSKGAVITLMELLAEEFKEQGFIFNTLALGAVQTEMLAEAFPDYQAPVTAAEMAEYIADFSLTGQKMYNGKVLQVSSSTP
ncbi:SDR family oxidoreductase [Flavobacteriaceae bacterium F08102]|nr:SDR family oxidoreductase [Flavobacteriaceae bacterium F08102]